ncbi:PX domain-containing protein EREL1-like isoform X1 [Salvia splendens]|uniref:PX domain-containing protein EREL1-like isoform X1 n=1 Tax=Salvia splendens TaxID=180675 RepID=UPI001C273C3A|nr:PX domain-containing protein EREL1-like isoform X1 [Salvia splendens]
MQRPSPPKHRHDGTSPLPLGMDWSPPPRIWAGRESVWPHDPRTGWSYCITLPSWIVLAKSRDSDPTVFYRVQVGIQSPEGITTTRTVLRRFNDFLKLHAALKRAFPQKSIPSTPPKGLLRMKTRAMLEARRSSLEEWMANLLSDIDLSRSIVVASFLELEAAARSSFQEEGLQSPPDSHNSVTMTDSSHHVHPNSSMLAAGTSSVASDHGSDTAYEISDIGSPSLGRDNNSEVGTEDLSFYDDATSTVDKFVKYGMSNIDEGLSMGNAILEKLENFPKHKLHARENHNSEQNLSNGSSLKASHHEEDMSEHLAENSSLVHHGRKLSTDSIGSNRSSLRGSESSSLAFPNSNGHGAYDLGSAAEVGRTTGIVGNSDYHLPDDIHLLVPVDQRQKMNRVLMTMQRRLITAKTDMEDLILRLNQEIAVKGYLATKVKDLEVELETTKQKSKENLEQAILIERERVTQMQWDMEELRRRSMELELKLNQQQDQSTDAQPSVSPGNQQTDTLRQELDSSKQQFEDLLKRHQELEVKSKADIKVLVKEVRSLRSSQSELTQQLKQSLREKSEMEELLQEERERNEQVRSSWRKLLDRCKILQDQLQECNIDNLTSTKGDTADSLPSLLDQLDFVGTSENQIDLLIAEFEQLLAEDGDKHTTSIDEESRQTLTSLLADNGALRKQVNSLIVNSLKMRKSKEKGETSDVNVGSEVQHSSS